MTVLGIDSGGTKTLAVFVSEAGEVADLVTGQGLDPTRATDAEAELNGFLAPLARAEAVTLGLPYHGEIARFSAMQVRVAAGRMGPAARVCNDVEIAHIGAFGGGNGVLCLAGTGSMAWAKGPIGIARAGGFGDLIGDEGSAFRIGQRALAQLSQEVDGRRTASPFGAALIEALGIAAAELIEWTYGHANPRAGIASVARTVSRLAEAGDGTAQDILRNAGAELAATASAAAQAAGLPGSKPWACAGGVFSDRTIRAELERRLGSDPAAIVLPPVGGAALDAALRAGWHIGPSWIATLRDGLRQRGVA